MMRTIGELTLPGGDPLVKMWSITVSPAVRPFFRHSHTRFEITVVNAGKGAYTTENAVFPISEGDVFVFSSNEIHSITRIDEELSITNLHFEPRFLIEGHTDKCFLNFCFFHAPDFQNRVPAPEAGFLRTLMSRIQDEFEKTEPEQVEAIRSYLQLAVIELLRHHGYRSDEDDPQSGASFDMAKVYQYIEDHYAEDIRLCDVARVASLSPNYFSHLFRKLNGISLWEYITSRRVEKAAQLIAERKKDAALPDIAMQCGFHNTVNFNKAFKRLNGITPGALKKNPKLLLH